MLDQLPSDFHPLILKGLPSKSLLRFLTVSKTWYSIIKSPTFISSHNNHQKSLNNSNHHNYKFLWKNSCDYRVLYYHKPRGENLTRLPSPPNDFNVIANALDGLVVCQTKSNHSNLLIWNPSIDRFKILNDPPSSMRVFGLGLGCNRVEDDYYAVLIFLNHRLREGYALSAHVYSVVKNPSLGWKTVSLPLFEDTVSSMSNGCFLNDNLHWILLRRVRVSDWSESKEFGFSILTFEANKDSFAQMELPRALKEAADAKLSLAVVGGSLAVVHLPRSVWDRRASVDVWKMEVYGVGESWKVVYKLDVYPSPRMRALAQEDGKVFATSSCGTLLSIFNVVSDGYGVYKGDVAIFEDPIFAYNESLLLLDGLRREQLDARYKSLKTRLV